MKALFGNIEAAPTPNDSKGRVVQAVGWKGENAHPHCVLCAPWTRLFPSRDAVPCSEGAAFSCAF